MAGHWLESLFSIGILFPKNVKIILNEAQINGVAAVLHLRRKQAINLTQGFIG
jgi:hypothetical protein